MSNVEVLIADMHERQRRLLRLRQPRRETTKADRRLDRIVQGDRRDWRWTRKQYRRAERAKVRAMGKLGPASRGKVITKDGKPMEQTT